MKRLPRWQFSISILIVGDLPSPARVARSTDVRPSFSSFSVPTKYVKSSTGSRPLTSIYPPSTYPDGMPKTSPGPRSRAGGLGQRLLRTSLGFFNGTTSFAQTCAGRHIEHASTVSVVHSRREQKVTQQTTFNKTSQTRMHHTDCKCNYNYSI